jgi:2-polyprenyl-6-methoxyphenol hydroxylase-like FAD-dependent oxidoreductase
MSNLEVLVIGAGTGGLALAHGLRAAGISVRVFERDRTAFDRPQGYRLTINATGARALRSCLPESNFQQYIAASAKVSTAVTFFDHKLKRLLSIDLPATDQGAPDAARPISRIALRQLLLEGLGDTVSFGKALWSFEIAPSGRVTARFADGSSAAGDVLIGADGASSHVRHQLLPYAERINTGLVAISGKLPLDASVRQQTPEAILNGPTLILGPRGCFMFAGAVEYPPNHPGSFDSEEYVMWGFSARREALGITDSAEEMASEDARSVVLAQLFDWSPEIRTLVERAESHSLTSFAVKSSVPIDAWPTQRVTLLGDALHNMTPYRGIGANTALRDAASLRDALSDVNKGAVELLPALSAYERRMINYGFQAVQASLAQMERIHAQSPLARFATKTYFRITDSFPALKKQMISEAE